MKGALKCNQNTSISCFMSCQLSSSPVSALGWFKSLLRTKVLSNGGQNGPCMITEPAQTGPILLLKRCWVVAFQRTDQTCKSCQNWSMYVHWREFWPTLVPGTKVTPWRPHILHGVKRQEHDQEFNTGALSEAKGWVFRKMWLPKMAQFQKPPIETCPSSISTEQPVPHT